MTAPRCASPSCAGTAGPVGWLGVCARCAHPSNYGDDRMSSPAFDNIHGSPTLLDDDLNETETKRDQTT